MKNEQNLDKHTQRMLIIKGYNDEKGILVNKLSTDDSYIRIAIKTRLDEVDTIIAKILEIENKPLSE